MKTITLLKGDCLQKLKELEDNSVDSVVTDPPYGLEFMGKEWDSFKTGRISKYKEGGKLDVEAIQSRKGKGGAGPSYTKRAAKKCRTCGKQEWSGSPCKCEEPDFEIDNSTQLTFQEFSEAWARECYRVLKPGGHLLAFAGSRMYHRLAVGVEDAGFEIRDQIMWIYGSGFPKSHNLIKQIEKQFICQFTKHAKTNSVITQLKHFQVELNEGKIDSVLTNVVMYQEEGVENKTAIGVVVDSSPTDMSIFVTKEDIEPNTILSLNNLLEENLKKEKKFITLTELKQIIDLKIFNLLPNQNTLKSIETLHGTALKPSHEPIVMARKPFKGSVAGNVLEWGTGGINIDESRIGYVSDYDKKHQEDIRKGTGTFFGGNGDSKCEQVDMQGRFPANIIFECTCDTTHTKPAPKSGHWPKGKTKGFGEFGGGESSYEGVGPKEEGDMVIHTDPNCPCYILDQQSGFSKSNTKAGKVENKGSGVFLKEDGTQATGHKHKVYPNTIQDEGGASRFFYCPKASKKDRNEGCDELEEKSYQVNFKESPKEGSIKKYGIEEALERLKNLKSKNNHPTVKPTDLMAYLVRLVTPKGGVVLDPFMGSGSTGKACVREGFDFIGIEREDEYMEIAKTRIEYEQKKNKHTQFFDI